jgi:hypothetical protein
MQLKKSTIQIDNNRFLDKERILPQDREIQPLKIVVPFRE